MFVTSAETPTVTAVTGTVSVNSGSTALTTSSGQSNWIGQTLQITGDSSSGTYRVMSGSGNSWVISPSYGGSTNAVLASATQTATNPPAVVTGIASAPTIQVQFGGTGSFSTVNTWGPVGSPTTHSLPWVAWQLLCGPIQSIVVQNGGSGYVSPTASASGGGGSGLTLGTPVMTGGVTSYSVGNSGGTGYTSAPTVTVAPPSIALAGTLTAGSASVTGLSSTAGLLPGMMVLGAGSNACAINTITSTTALTLTQPATNNGSTTLTFIGRTALATATVNTGTGKVTAINVFVPGSGYSGAPTVTLSGGGYTAAATATATVTNIIGEVPVTSPGSGYTSPPTISISDGTGTGATAVALMGGVGPTDVVRYSAADSWITSTLGAAAAAANAIATNYAGQLEAGVGTSYGFNLPTNQRICGAGQNIFSGSYWNACQATANWLVRSKIPSSANVVSATLDGRPLMLNGTAAYDISTPVANYIDANCNPSPIATGVNGDYWTFIADEMTPSNPTQISMTGQSCTITTTFTEGTATTGVNSQPTLVSGGSGYTDTPTVSFFGGGGSGRRPSRTSTRTARSSRSS